jgi:hypothetical protein
MAWPALGAGLPVQGQALGVVVGGPLKLASLRVQHAEVAEDSCLTRQPTGLPGPRQRAGVVLGRLGVIAQTLAGRSEVAVGDSLAYRCGTSEFTLDPHDPFVAGFVLR